MATMLMTSICRRCWGAAIQRECERCDQTGSVVDLSLSNNFKLSELTWSRTAYSQNIANDPDIKHVERLMETVHYLLQPLRDAIGPLLVTSGFRSPSLNQAIGGSKNSAHMAGWAADVQTSWVPLDEAMQWLWEHRDQVMFDQAILELGRHHNRTNDDWLHLGYRHPESLKQRQQFLVMENGVYRAWKPGEKLSVS